MAQCDTDLIIRLGEPTQFEPPVLLPVAAKRIICTTRWPTSVAVVVVFYRPSDWSVACCTVAAAVTMTSSVGAPLQPRTHQPAKVILILVFCYVRATASQSTNSLNMDPPRRHRTTGRFRDNKQLSKSAHPPPIGLNATKNQNN